MLTKVVIVLNVFVILVVGQNKKWNERMIFPSLPNGEIFSGNTLCKEDTTLFKKHLDNSTLWAYEMWDATAKSTDGVLRGSVYQLGDFVECMSVEAPFSTQYCLATITAHIPDEYELEDPYTLYHNPYESVLTRIYKTRDESQLKRHQIHVGWCTPASCTPKILLDELNEYLKEMEHPFKSKNVNYTAEIDPEVCQTQSDVKQVDAADICFCLVCFTLLMCITAATIFDVYYAKALKKTRIHRLCVAFSIPKNFRELTTADLSNPSLNILYGIRTACMFMIIMYHRFSSHMAGRVMNYDDFEKEYRSDVGWLVFHGDLFVDSFFTFSGLLVAYTLLSHADKQFLNPGFLLILRYIRLTPIYAFVIFYYATLLEYAGSGPMWTTVILPEVQDCQNNWYINLIYLNNYINDEHLCMLQTWYLPCDFHYFVVGLFICFLISKKKLLGLGVLVATTIISVVLPFAITIVYERPALMHWYPELLVNIKGHHEFRELYSKSHLRGAPYFIGMMAGYMYYKLKKTEKIAVLTKMRCYIIFAVSLFLLLLSPYCGTAFYNPYHTYNALESASYASLHRAVWSLGTVGLLVVFSYGPFSIIRSALSWMPCIPLSKLTYGAYLTHFIFQLRSIGMTPAPRIFNYFNVVSLALSDIVLAFSSAAILYLAVEAPFRKIFKELLMPPKNVSEDITNPPIPLSNSNKPAEENHVQ